MWGLRGLSAKLLHPEPGWEGLWGGGGEPCGGGAYGAGAGAGLSSREDSEGLKVKVDRYY